MTQQQPPPQNFADSPAEQGNGLAVAGFVLAFLVAPLGLILSIIGLNKAKQLSGKPGHGLAIAGIIISILGILITSVVVLLIIALGLPAAQTILRDEAREDDIRGISLALTDYSSDDANPLPKTPAELSQALEAHPFLHYSKFAGISGDLKDSGKTFYIAVKTDLVPGSADPLPSVDQVHILIGARCGAVLPELYVAGNYGDAQGLLAEDPLIRASDSSNPFYDFAIVYRLEDIETTGEPLLCQDGSVYSDGNNPSDLNTPS